MISEKRNPVATTVSETASITMGVGAEGDRSITFTTVPTNSQFLGLYSFWTTSPYFFLVAYSYNAGTSTLSFKVYNRSNASVTADVTVGAVFANI